LLHCSNMALLNERGSEAEVRRRDAERERLKAEGKLTTAATTNADDFATSVDSHGFHHARAPSMDMPAEIKPLQVQNTSEDDFEKVIAPEVAVDALEETKNEKDQIGEPLQRSPKVAPKTSPPEKPAEGEADLVDEPLTPPKDSPQNEAATTPKPADDAESPTSAGLSAKVGDLDLDNDTVMGEHPESSDSAPAEGDAKDRPSLLTQQLSQSTETGSIDPSGRLSPHPDDKPAPLFAGKSRESHSEAPTVDTGKFTAPAAPGTDASEITPIDDSGSVRSVVFGNIEDDANAGFEIDIDGTAVVGDLLKITFVENKVVPTILVSTCHSNQSVATKTFRISSSGFHGITSSTMSYTMWSSKSLTDIWTTATTVL
jgi:SIT4-associating protein SAP185/190